MMTVILLIFLLLINILGFVIMGIDKRKARNKSFRISEKTFFIVSLLGGSLGTWVGMYLFRHKTRHWYFVAFIPVISVLQIILLIILTLKGVIHF